MRILIMLNGQPPRRELLEALAAEAHVLIGADAGAARLREAGMRIDYVVGDFDSVPAELLHALPAESVVHDPGQEDTDLEKALRFALTRWQRPQIVVVGTTGDRLDHVLGNVCGAVRYADRADIRFVEDHSITYFGHRRVQFEAPVATTVSLLPLGEVQGVRTRGLKWALHGETLTIGTRGVSNVVESSPVSITWEQGYLVVIRLLATPGDAFLNGEPG